MENQDLLTRYNYDIFEPKKFEPWLNFKGSPPLWESLTDFPLWTLQNEQTSLSEVWKQHLYTIVEFGSFT